MIEVLKDDIIRRGRIGIMPIGALSIAFASYIPRVDTFIESGKTHYGLGKNLKIKSEDKIREIFLTNDNYTDNILSLAFRGMMPEVILFSPPNHRLIPVLDDVIFMINKIVKIIGIKFLIIDNYIPMFVMMSNGIYYYEAMDHLRNNLKSVNQGIRDKLIERFVRGTTVQTGTREEDEITKELIFKPGTKGSITIGGSNSEIRRRIINLLIMYDYPVVNFIERDVRKMEFDKAMFNLPTNGVQLSMVYDEDGNFHNYTLGDLISNKEMREKCNKIINVMASIGVKAGIYKQNDYSEKRLIEEISQKTFRNIWKKSKKDNTHIVSSLAIVIEKYKQGKIKGIAPKLPPLEENIINYLLKLTDEFSLEEEKKTILELKNNILYVCGEVACM